MPDYHQLPDVSGWASTLILREFPTCKGGGESKDPDLSGSDEVRINDTTPMYRGGGDSF